MAIISLSGKIGSAKSTVASMIQYITSEARKKGRSFETFLERTNNPEAFGNWYWSEWEQKSYAKKLKQIASLLTGIPEEKFSDQEFKKTLLGEEWRVYYTVLKPAHHPIDKDTQRVSEFYMTEQEVKDRWFNGGEPRDKFEIGTNILSVREFLQLLGTNAIRNGLHPNTWINALYADYKDETGIIKGITITQGVSTPDISIGKGFPKWIITDCRFPNELQAVKDRNGVTIRVTRPNNPYPASSHESETALDNSTFDYEIVNDGSLEYLLVKVEDVYNKIVSNGE